MTHGSSIKTTKKMSYRRARFLVKSTQKLFCCKNAAFQCVVKKEKKIFENSIKNQKSKNHNNGKVLSQWNGMLEGIDS